MVYFQIKSRLNKHIFMYFSENPYRIVNEQLAVLTQIRCKVMSNVRDYLNTKFVILVTCKSFMQLFLKVNIK